MDEYINRRELAERIGKYVKAEAPEEKELIEWCKDECIRQAYCMPFVILVRCADCKHCNKYTNWNNKEYLGCSWNGEIYEVEAEHYCSYGERRTEDE